MDDKEVYAREGVKSLEDAFGSYYNFVHMNHKFTLGLKTNEDGD